MWEAKRGDGSVLAYQSKSDTQLECNLRSAVKQEENYNGDSEEKDVSPIESMGKCSFWIAKDIYKFGPINA